MKKPFLLPRLNLRESGRSSVSNYLADPLGVALSHLEQKFSRQKLPFVFPAKITLHHEKFTPQSLQWFFLCFSISRLSFQCKTDSLRFPINVIGTSVRLVSAFSKTLSPPLFFTATESDPALNI